MYCSFCVLNIVHFFVRRLTCQTKILPWQTCYKTVAIVTVRLFSKSPSSEKQKQTCCVEQSASLNCFFKYNDIKPSVMLSECTNDN